LNLYQGQGELRIGGKNYEFKPGYASITVPGLDMEYRFRGQTVLTWAHFFPAEPGPVVPIPVMQDLGGDFSRIRDAVAEGAIQWRFCPSRAAARLWDVLWELSQRAVPPHPELHPALRRAMILVDERLSEPIRAADMARCVGISHTHLARLFRAAQNQSIIQYVRARRMERALHMLRQTNLPIQSVARQVGISDIQLFNKMVRRAAGMSPRKVRETQPRE
jgi:AraC-like DNA-binding protein